MNNKKNHTSVYFLGVVVFVIWGAVFLRFFSYSKDVVPIIDESKLTEVAIVNPIKKKFELFLNYADPFKSELKNNASRSARPHNDLNNRLEPSKLIDQRESLVKSKNDSISAPLVSYIGLFSNISNNKRVGIIEINKKRHVLMEGTSNQGIQIVKLTADSLVYKYDDSQIVLHNQRK